MRHIIILFIALFSVACTATSYKDAVSVTKLNDRIYLIQSQGNELTDYERVSNYALLKAADICIERNFTKFVILDEQAGTSNIRIFNALRVYFLKADEESPPDAYDCFAISIQLMAYGF